jgi:hypothetical protein
MMSLDRSSLDEQVRLVPRYVAGDLSRSERADFEAWLVASPELAAEVEMERRLRRGIASAARRGWINRGAPEHTPQRRRWSMAIAASVLLTVGAAVSLTLRQDNAPNYESQVRIAGSLDPGAAPLVARLARTRGHGDRADILISLAQPPSELVIEPRVVTLTCLNGAVEFDCADGSTAQYPQYPEYEVFITSRRAQAQVWLSARQQPVMGDQLSFTLSKPASLLPVGEYDLSVRGVSSDHEQVVARYWLSVTAQ